MHPTIDKELRIYIPVIDFLSQLLGDNTEIVLHDVKTKELGASVVYIKNALTGRSVGSPATDLLLNILKNESYKDSDYRVNYRSKSCDGREFKSSSLFIKNDCHELIGMICVNTDQTIVEQVGKKMEDALEWFSHLTNYTSKCKENDTVIDETLYGSVGSMIDQAVFYVTGYTEFLPEQVTRAQKLNIVKYLNDRGYFAHKNSVSDLAQVFQLSEVTVYKYLQIVKNDALKEDI